MKVKSLKNLLAASILVLSLLSTLAACGQKADSEGGAAESRETAQQQEGTKNQEEAKKEEAKKLSGEINIDGSSTVYPISSAIGEEFSKLNPDVRVSVGFSGTGGGMKKFYAGQIPIADASRPIKQNEIDECKKNDIEYTEFTVAYDGISVVVNTSNDWAESITVEELKKMWEPDSKVKTWKDVNTAWPDQPIKFYAPGTDSGTFEYFTEAIMGKAGAIRTDITPSEDDNVLVTGVANDKYAIGFFGYAYYEENKDKLKVLSIDAGNGPVEPAAETIKNGTYKPLARPVFIYVNNKNLAEDHIKEFVKYYLTEGTKLIPDVGYVPLETKDYEAQLAKIK